MSADTGTYRLITRPDFDGVVCGALFMEQDMIDTVMFAHPRDMQHGKIAVSSEDITTNLPYVPGVHLCFDHHVSESERVGPDGKPYHRPPRQPSAARVVYDHYGARETFSLVDPRIDRCRGQGRFRRLHGRRDFGARGLYAFELHPRRAHGVGAV